MTEQTKDGDLDITVAIEIADRQLPTAGYGRGQRKVFSAAQSDPDP